MNSRFTLGLAGVLLTGAIFVGYWGLVLSHPPSPIAKTVTPPTALLAVETFVVTAEDQTRVHSSEERRLARYWPGESDSPANIYTANSRLFQFTQLALGAASKGLARNDLVATLHPAIEIIGNQTSRHTP